MLIAVASTLFVYVLFWAVCAFLVLPFCHRSRHEEGSTDLVPGQDSGAPGSYNGRAFLWRTTVVATLFYALFYANYVNGWVTLDDVSVVHPPAQFTATNHY